MARKFSPFRMTQRTQKAILVALGVFLMVIFAIPTRSACRRAPRDGRDPRTVVTRLGGRPITYADLDDVRRRWAFILHAELSDAGAADVLARLHEAERAGLYISDDEVLDAIQNTHLPRRVIIEYVFARHDDFEKKAVVGDAAVRAFYDKHKATRFVGAEGKPRPLSEVRDEIAAELRRQQAPELARRAVGRARKDILAAYGKAVRDSLRAASDTYDLSHGETKAFTIRTPARQLTAIGGVPNIVQRGFNDPIGQPSEIIALDDRVVVFRVTRRTYGFGPGGLFYREQENWLSEGFGVGNRKEYDDLLREMRVTQAQFEQTVRESLAYNRVYELYAGATRNLPALTVRDRYDRDNTEAVAAYFTLSGTDFASSVVLTEDELRSFYNRHRTIEPTDTQVGYRQPERVRIEYVLGSKSDIKSVLSDDERREHYEQNRHRFKEPFDKIRATVVDELADERLKALIGEIIAEARGRASRREDPDLPGLANDVARPSGRAFVARTPAKPLTNVTVASALPDLRGADLAKELFGPEAAKYLTPGDERKGGRRYISQDFKCDKGRFFFRLLSREPGAELPYERLIALRDRPPDPAGGPKAAAERKAAIETYSRLRLDLRNDKAARAAQDKAREYRAKIHQAAFDRFARAIGATPVDTEFLKADSPIPPLGKPLRALYDQLALAPVGDLSRIVRAADRFLLARLADRDEAKGLKLQLLAFRKAGLPKKFAAAYAPATYQLQARYDDDPYRFLDKPKPEPFGKVKTLIASTLTRRRVLAEATDRIDKALADLKAADPPKLADVAKTHSLALTPGLKIDLAKTHAAPQIGTCPSLRDALTALEPGQASTPLANAAGRYALVLKSRDDTSAVIDLLAANYDTIRKTIKIDDKDLRTYYDDNRDVAFVTDDEIKTAPSWEDLPDSARGRIRKDLRDAWAKRAIASQLAALRASFLLEAFRTVPPKHPLEAKRDIELSVRQPGPFKPKDPQDIFKTQPDLLKAILKLKPGQLSQPIETQSGALLALLKDKQADQTVDIAYVTIQRWLWEELGSPQEPTDKEIEEHYEAHKERFRIPPELQIEYLAATFEALRKNVAATDEEIRKEYDRGVRDGDSIYRDHSKLPDVVAFTFEQAKDTARRQVLAAKAHAQAKTLLDQAHKELTADGAAVDFKALADKHPPLVRGLSSFFQRDFTRVAPIGLAPELIAKAFAAKEGELIGPVTGLNGMCVARRHESRPSRIPPLADIRPRVLDHYRRHHGNQKALAAAATLRKRVAAAVKNAKDKPKAFAAAVEAEPLTVTVPKPIRVDLTRPFYPYGSERFARANLGVARTRELAEAVFRLRPSDLSPVVRDAKGGGCYVATPTRFIAPPEPTASQLLMAQATLLYGVGRREVLTPGLGAILELSWQAYLNDLIKAEP